MMCAHMDVMFQQEGLTKLPFVRLTWYELNSCTPASRLQICLSKGKNVILKLQTVVKSERILKNIFPLNKTNTLTLLNQSNSLVLAALEKINIKHENDQFTLSYTLNKNVDLDPPHTQRAFGIFSVDLGWKVSLQFHVAILQVNLTCMIYME